MESRKRIESKHIIDALQDRIGMQFQSFRDLKYNPNTKGADLEGIVMSFFNEYFSSRFEFHKRAQLIDENMDYLELLPSGSNEMDVIAAFNNITPRLFLKVRDTSYIPYDGVAFFIEVKRMLDKKKLEDDLNKLQNVAKLQLNPKRFGSMMLSHRFFVNRPLRILFYFEQKINISTIEQILESSADIWDVVLILHNNQGRTDIAVSKSIPLGRVVAEILYRAKMNTQSIPDNVRKQKFFWFEDLPFILLFYIILGSIPIPIFVNVMPTFMKIAPYAFQK